jgi:hypothetical protein
MMDDIIQRIFNETQTDDDYDLLVIMDDIIQRIRNGTQTDDDYDLLVRYLVAIFSSENSLERNIHEVFLIVVELLSDSDLDKFLYLLRLKISEESAFIRSMENLQEALIDLLCIDLKDKISIQTLQSQAFAWKLMETYYYNEGNRLAADPDYCIDYFPSGLGPYDLLSISWGKVYSVCIKILKSIDSNLDAIKYFEPNNKTNKIIEYIEAEKVLDPDSIKAYYENIGFLIDRININQSLSPVRKVSIKEGPFTPISVY